MFNFLGFYLLSRHEMKETVKMAQRDSQRKIDDLEYKLMYTQDERNEYRHRANRAIRERNKLVEQINARGGQSFLDGKVGNAQFSASEINALIQLCHPDKHNGKASATEMTAKLLKLRK